MSSSDSEFDELPIISSDEEFDSADIDDTMNVDNFAVIDQQPENGLENGLENDHENDHENDLENDHENDHENDLENDRDGRSEDYPQILRPIPRRAFCIRWLDQF